MRMAHRGPKFYDNPSVFEEYRRRRARPDNPNDTIERPIFLEMVGNVAHSRILDLGCGTAELGLDFIGMGCAQYTGLEGSLKMAEAGRETLRGTIGKIVHAPIEEWDYPAGAYDLISSRLVLHYIEDLQSCFANVHRALIAGGRFIFSVEHPLLTSSKASAALSPRRTNWIVDHYFDTGERSDDWMGASVLKYHRTIEDYFALVRRAGFRVTDLRESRPSLNRLTSEEYARRMRIPLFLFIAAEA